METYRSTIQAKKWEDMGHWEKFKFVMQYLHFKWELYSQLYVLDKEEKPWFYLILICIVALFLYGAVNYLPPYFTAIGNAQYIFRTDAESTHTEMWGRLVYYNVPI